MQNIDQLRAEVDQIHQEMVGLFRQRLKLTRQIWELKKANSLPFIDPKREEAIIHQWDSLISDADEKQAVQNFLQSLLLESRKYLEVKSK